MAFFSFSISLFSFFLSSLCAEVIDTFYGPIEVEEPLLLELIHSPAFERLKYLHQYGVSYYIKTHPEEYTRYAHSLGVFAILRSKGASLEEQIAGLLHDASHTVFSHVGDWVFARENQENDYQSEIHQTYLEKCGIEEILNRYGYTGEQISPKNPAFQMLEQSLPNLCADRIDYNIQGAYFQEFLTYEETQRLFHDLTFQSGKWLLKEKELASKLTRFSLFMTESCWGSALNSITSRWLADAVLEGLKTGLISSHQFHFGTDQEIWDLLLESKNPYIVSRMDKLRFPDPYYRMVDPDQTKTFLRFKSRGIDPWILNGEEIVRLTSLDSELESSFQKTKIKSLEGWPVKIFE